MSSATDVIKSTENIQVTAAESSSPPDLVSLGRSLRPRKPVCYTELPELDADSFIWCSECDSMEFHGCEIHITLFGDNKMFKLQVEPSGVGPNAGEGVFNRGQMIPEGTVFGPYTGAFIPIELYEKMAKETRESGNAWEILDKTGKRTLGYRDPGVNPDPEKHWMAKVNCANMLTQQNLVAFQLAGQIYYRAMVDIQGGVELLVFYGKTYAEGLGIDVKVFRRYNGKENQVTEALLCEYCNDGLSGEAELNYHLAMGDAGSYRCREKQAKEMIRMAKSGERKWVCKECGKGYKSKRNLSVHGNVHTKLRKYVCQVLGCGKSFTESGGLSRHKKSSHENVFHECPECGRRFGQKGDMTRHYNNVHQEEKPHKCVTCGLQFSRNHNLTQHIKTVHQNIRDFKCQHCGKSFGKAGARKNHVEAVHLKIRYPCTWWEGGCSYTTGQMAQVKFHIRQVHTKEWSWECQLCEDQEGIWWGCIQPGQMDKHKAKKHPVEWEEEQEAYRQAHPFVCKYKDCQNRYATKVECDRHQVKLH